MAEATSIMEIGGERYQLRNKLGYGAFSWAVLANKESDSTVVALKFTKQNDSGSERAIRRQQQEINTELDTFQKVRHPNVVALHGFDPDVEYAHKDGSSSRCFCMALECCEGGELFDIVYYTGRLEEKVARTLFNQITAGLTAMPKVGLCHRDIKPQNILLTADFQVKIADFGSSKLFNREELMKTFRVGTKGFQAPEVLLSRGYTLKCDIFSLGVMLFVILTKHPPFRQAVSEDQWFRQIAKKQFAAFWTKHPRDNLSRPCRDLICKMLCYQPLDRLTIGGVASHPWSAMEVYSKSQMKRILTAKKENATKGRLNDSARCPLNYNSEQTRAGEEKITMKPLPAHLEFRALDSKDHPWKAINFLMENFAMGSSKACKGELTPEQCRLRLEATTTVKLGFKIEGVEQEETEQIVIDIVGYSDPKSESSFYLDIAIKTGYSEPAQQFFNKILALLNMDVKPPESGAEENNLELDEIAGEMTEEEKKEAADRKAQLAAIQASLDPEEIAKIQQDVITASKKSKKKKKKSGDTEEEVAPAST